MGEENRSVVDLYSDIPGNNSFLSLWDSLCKAGVPNRKAFTRNPFMASLIKLPPKTGFGESLQTGDGGQARHFFKNGPS